MIIGQSTYLRTLQILFFGLFTGPILFLAVVIFLQLGNQHVEQTTDSTLFFIAVGFASMGIIGSRAYYNSQKSKFITLPAVNSKLAAWRTAFIVRVAMIEGPALFCVVGLFLEEQRVFLVLFIVLTAFQALNYPSKNRVIDDLQISDADLE